MFCTTTTPRPSLRVAVVMRREPVAGPMSRWQPWRWTLADVLTPADGPQDLPSSPPGQPPLPLALEPDAAAALPQGTTHWLYPGFEIELFADDVEGYYLNASSPQPCYWVMWRPDEARLPDGEAAPQPQIVTLSYHDAGRWLDAQEQVEQVPLPAALARALAAWVDEHYQPEPKRRQRPASFQSLTDRFGNPARVSTGERRRRGGSEGS